MRDQLILLPGWAYGPAALQPLCEALKELDPDLDVVIEPLPELADPEAWLDELDRRLPDDSWLAGWSALGFLPWTGHRRQQPLLPCPPSVARSDGSGDLRCLSRGVQA